MFLNAAPDYAIIKINKQIQEDKKNKIGRFYVPPSEVSMWYNVEWGEIVSIGARALRYFPQAKIGQNLIVHHFVQGDGDEESRINHLIYEDDEFRYYAVTTRVLASDSFSKRNETYGVDTGNEIIPHPDFIFLEYHEETPKSRDEQLITTKSGLFLFENWTESRESKALKLKELKDHNIELTKTTSKSKQREIKEAILRNEEEMDRIGKDMNFITFSKFRVAYANPSINDYLKNGMVINAGDFIYAQSNACNTIVQYKDTKFRIAETKYMGYLRR